MEYGNKRKMGRSGRGQRSKYCSPLVSHQYCNTTIQVLQSVNVYVNVIQQHKNHPGQRSSHVHIKLSMYICIQRPGPRLLNNTDSQMFTVSSELHFWLLLIKMKTKRDKQVQVWTKHSLKMQQQRNQSFSADMQCCVCCVYTRFISIKQ